MVNKILWNKIGKTFWNKNLQQIMVRMRRTQRLIYSLNQQNLVKTYVTMPLDVKILAQAAEAQSYKCLYT